jgi:hypothetical protein
MRDAYERFFEVLNISPDAFFQFGLDEIIHVPFPAAQTEWNSLKRRIETGETVTIRSFGRNGANTHQFLALYAEIFDNRNIVSDATNNAKPTHLLQQLTGYSKTTRQGCERLSNYQVSHVFGRTKNPYAFTAPWNIVYIPKIIDPFTGHEAPGDRSIQFRTRFQKHMYGIFSPLIQEFNNIVTDSRIVNGIHAHVERLRQTTNPNEAFIAAVQEAFKPIKLLSN